MIFTVGLAAVALFAAGASAQTFTIATPFNVVVCQPVLLSWSGGTAPYFLSVLPGNQPSAAALEDLGTQTGDSFTWTVDIAAGTSIGLTIRDSTGATVSSAPFDIQSGTDTSCIGKNSASASGSTSSDSTVVGSTAATAATTTTKSETSGTTTVGQTTATGSSSATTPVTTSKATSTAGTTASGTTTSAAASGTESTNAAPTNVANLGAAGLLGAAVIALLA